MKIRTLDELSDLLSSELAWRKKELSDLKYFIETNQTSSERKRVLSRCGVALLYAHWEGFVKLAGRYFLEFLATKKLKNKEIKDNLLTLSMKGKVNFSFGAKKASELGKITDFFLNRMEERAIIPYKTAIDTESNLSSVVFKEIVWCLGIEYNPYETKEKFFDCLLLARRNSIAHGQDLNIDIKEYNEMRKTLLEMMTILKIQIENCAISKAYLRS